MGVKLGGLVKKYLEKSGSFKEEKHKELVEKLNELDGDLDDDDVKVLSEAFITTAEAAAHPEVKKTLKETFRKELKSEFLDPVDTELKPYEALLDEKTREDYAKADTSYKKLKLITGFLSKRGSGDGKDAESYRKKLEEVLKQIETKEYIPKADFEKISSQVSTALEGKTMALLFAKSVPKMSKGRLADKMVNEDFETRTQKLLKKRGWVINHETGEVRKASDPEEAVFVEGSSEKMTLEDLPEAYFKEYDDWMAKSDGGKADEYEVERQGGNSNADSTAEKNRKRAMSV